MKDGTKYIQIRNSNVIRFEYAKNKETITKKKKEVKHDINSNQNTH